MGLEFKVESLEGVDESVKGMYVEKDGAFVLDVSGLPEPENVDGLKSALDKERTAAKEAQKKLKEIEDKQRDNVNASLAEKEQWKELAENLQKEVDESKNRLINSEKTRFSDRIVNNLTKDSKRAKLLAKELSQHLEVGDDDVKIVGLAGVETGDQLEAHFKEHYAFLTDGSQAQGGGAAGNKGGIPQGNLLTKEEVRALPEGDKRAYFAKNGYNNYKEV